MKYSLWISLVFFYTFCGISLSAKDFDPAACPDLAVRIYPGNNGWRVLHATSCTYMHSALGYDFVGVAVPENKNVNIVLKMVMGIRKSAQLDFLMTIPDTAALRVFLYGSGGNDASKDFLNVSHCGEGTICFIMPMESSGRKRLEAIRIDMKTNTAECFLQPGQKLPVEWNENGFCIKGLKGGSEDFEFVMPFSNYRGTKGGITSVRRKTGTRWLIFPAFETFYLDSGK